MVYYFVSKYELTMENEVEKMWTEIRQLVFDRCEGCLNDILNQEGHFCVMGTDFDHLMKYFDEAFERVHGFVAYAPYLFKLCLEIRMYASLEGWTLAKAKRFCDYSNTLDDPIEIDPSDTESDSNYFDPDIASSDSGL